jgi:nonribosomal peptide synthetase DhbF
VTTVSVQRLIEQQAAVRGERTAILNQGETISYRELNHRANVVARYLMTRGFRRGGHAIAHMPRGIELAVVLLAVLKAGGTYTWFDPAMSSTGYPRGVSIQVDRSGSDEPFLYVDVGGLLAEPAQQNPNLPIVTRGSDTACVLHDIDGTAAVLVPHATIASLVDRRVPDAGRWTGEAGALDLWLGLMSGVMVTVEERPEQSAAA